MTTDEKKPVIATIAYADTDETLGEVVSAPPTAPGLVSGLEELVRYRVVSPDGSKIIQFFTNKPIEDGAVFALRGFRFGSEQESPT